MGIGSKIRSALSSDSASDINDLNSSPSVHRHSADSGYASANSPTVTASRLPAGTGPGTTGKPAVGNTANVGSRRSVDASPNMRGNHNGAEAAAAGVGGVAAARGLEHEHDGRHTHQRGVDGVDGVDGMNDHEHGRHIHQRGVNGVDGADGMNVGNQRSHGGIIGRAEDRLERNHEQVSGDRTGDFPDPHSHGHIRAPNADIQPTGDNVHEETNHLQHVTHENVRLLETEEVVRQRDHDRHVHHVQHHVQPIHHQEVRDEVHHEMMHPVTRIHEKHANKDEDFVGLESQIKEHRDHIRHAPKERQIIDKGEIVNETTHHHVHHVIQPIIEKETLEKHRIHTVIPMHHVTHEAPIVHQSRVHEPMSMDDFLKRGHKLENGIAHHEVGRRVLNAGECEREVDGLGERIAKDLGISHGIAGHEHAARQEAGGVRGQGVDGARVGGQNAVDGRVGGQNTVV